MSAQVLARNTVIVGDVRKCLKRLPDASVDCVVTSPPYFLLRDYGVDGQIGLEDHVDGWVEELRLVMAGIARVLKPTGSVYLNLGDSYSRHPRYGAPAKSLLLGPERLVLALVADGWTLRNKVVWSKPNPMPTSVADRLNTTWEPVYVLTRSQHYFYDLDAIRIPHKSAVNSTLPSGGRVAERVPNRRPDWAGPLAGSNSGLVRLKREGRTGHALGKNPGDVWTFATAGFRDRHFATFPKRLVERPLLASCPERVCRRCGAPWRRDHVTTVVGQRVPARRDTHVMRFGGSWQTLHHRGELHPDCRCQAGWQPGLVLDPFFGAGTVALAAEDHERDWLGIELNPDYAELARARIVAARAERAPDNGEGRAA
jgi:site-specific DNA-methyltransferase (adenine-specific)